MASVAAHRLGGCQRFPDELRVRVPVGIASALQEDMNQPLAADGPNSTIKQLSSAVALFAIALAAVACSSAETGVASSSEAALHVGPNPLDTCGQAFNGTACGHAFYQGADLGAGFCWQHACVYHGCIMTGPAGAFDSYAPGETDAEREAHSA
jgi:hypothetical protein